MEKSAHGGERLYRAYGGESVTLRNCFFVPAIDATPIGHWTAELLEMELNAALWGNDFEGVTKFEMIKGARYLIGPIAHDNYSGYDTERIFYQRAFFTPNGIFKQVKFVLTQDQKLLDCVKKIGAFTLAEGRYAREASARAKRYEQ
ncbi:hypothetical protein [Paraburkholderia pallida]|uniref:Uncharacterized protein n=1 Tax=Paraburkholderia pallida TaxID=2547399 RepID=A0A4P7D451_9BURK|nr:hypothetical protein [Paraburkholderia pallida]QBR01505.1 hypothetical protein E1956_30440 [Paraburkholderia pallida]